MGVKLTRKLGAAVLLPVFLLALAATSSAAWRCQYDGVSRSVCCCPKKAANEGKQAPEGPAVTAQGCCDLERVVVERAPSEVSRSQPTVHPPTLFVAVLAYLVLPTPGPTHAFFGISAQAPPGGGGRSILLQKQTFLI